MSRNTTPSLKPRNVIDDGDRLGVLGVEELVRSGGRRRACVAAQERRARHEMLHDGAEDRGLELLPFAAGLGDRDEVGAEEDTAHPWNREQPLREWRLGGALLVTDVKRTVRQHRAAR